MRAFLSGEPARAEREVERILEKLTWDPSCGASDRVQAYGPGNVVCAGT